MITHNALGYAAYNESINKDLVEVIMTRTEFISLIGKDIVVDYPFFDEIQQWNMKNFYIDDDGNIKHKRITTLIVDVFIKKATNPHIGESTHG